MLQEGWPLWKTGLYNRYWESSIIHRVCRKDEKSLRESWSSIKKSIERDGNIDR